MAVDFIEIVQNGDVLLVLVNKDAVTKYRVNSTTMREASQVFNAMLGPNFAEGKALESNRLAREIQLHDNDRETLTTILTALHDQDTSVPQVLIAPNCIINVAILIDKHLLHDALKDLLAGWLANKSPQIGLEVAIILKNRKVFQETTRVMILEMKESYRPEYYSDEDEMPRHCFINVDKKRDLIRASIPAEVHAAALDLESEPNPCPRAFYHAGVILQKLYGLDSNKKQRLSATFEEVIHTLTQVIAPPHTHLCFGAATDCLMSRMQQRCQAHIDIMRDQFTGLCLYCEIIKFEGESGICLEGHSV